MTTQGTVLTGLFLGEVAKWSKREKHKMCCFFQSKDTDENKVSEVISI